MKNSTKRAEKKALKYRIRHITAEDFAKAFPCGMLDKGMDKLIYTLVYQLEQFKLKDLNDEALTQILDHLIAEFGNNKLVRAWRDRDCLERHLADIGEMPEVTSVTDHVYWYGWDTVRSDYWTVGEYKFSYTPGAPLSAVSVVKGEKEICELYVQPTPDLYKVPSGWLREHDSFEDCPLSAPGEGEFYAYLYEWLVGLRFQGAE